MTDSPVKLRLPATSGYLVLARTAVAALCARLDYPLDRLEDAKLAVNEACSLLLADAREGSAIDIELTSDNDGLLSVTLRAQTQHGRPPKQTSFAWTVLSALVDSVTASASNDTVTITLQASRGTAPAPISETDLVGS
ncbi:MAG: ATP-binding protein [Candidatus Nanopelagicales bacterium]